MKVLALGKAQDVEGGWHVLLLKHLITGSGESERSSYPIPSWGCSVSWGRQRQPRQMVVKTVISLGKAGLVFAKLKSW